MQFACHGSGKNGAMIQLREFKGLVKSSKHKQTLAKRQI
jgi:hypothetical protein